MNKFLLNTADLLSAIFGFLAILIIAPFIIMLGLISSIVERK